METKILWILSSMLMLVLRQPRPRISGKSNQRRYTVFVPDLSSSPLAPDRRLASLYEELKTDRYSLERCKAAWHKRLKPDAVEEAKASLEALFSEDSRLYPSPLSTMEVARATSAVSRNFSPIKIMPSGRSNRNESDSKMAVSVPATQRGGIPRYHCNSWGL